MGRGDPSLCDAVILAERRYPGQVCGYVGFDPFLERRMMSACDLLAMPSRYEPCGLPQMIAQMYGTVPLVTRTGGLRDSIHDLDEGPSRATGFFVEPPVCHDRLRSALEKALRAFDD